MSTVVTRIAPSPTGRMHIGTVRTALFNYLYAKHFGGIYFVRIEDTDRVRSKDEWTDAIWSDFAWCGLKPDSTYIQSEHLDRHRDLLHSLVQNGKAYISKEPAKDDPERFVEVVRLRNPGSIVTFDDLIRGPVTFDTTELGDFVIARSIDDPLYHFAVVVDDADAGVTHVLRAEEHISNTPRQILIQEALDVPRPVYAHLPLILAPDRSKLSKRKHNASIENYRDDGFLPEAIINYLGLLGWTPPDGREILSLDEMVSAFDIAEVHKSGAVFDIEKLRWFNREYLLRMDADAFADEVLHRLSAAVESRGLAWNESRGRALIPVIRERITLWTDIARMAGEGEFDFFFDSPKPAPTDLPQKGTDAETASKHLAKIHEIWAALPEESFMQAERLKESVWEYATMEGRGAVLWPTRYALSGRAKSPDPFQIASIIGKAETLARIEHARTVLQI